MEKKTTLLSDILWLLGWSVAYVLIQAAWKLAETHFGWHYSETAVAFGFLLYIIRAETNHAKLVSARMHNTQD